MPATTNLFTATADKIREYIIKNDLKMGDGLPSEAEFMKQFNVSRSTIREALKQIQALGILDIKPGRGAIIRDCNISEAMNNVSWTFNINPGLANLKEIVESRYLTEMSAIPFILNRATGMDMDDLEKLAATHYQEKDITVRRKIDIAFHRRFMSCTGNIILVGLSDLTSAFFQRLIQSSPYQIFPVSGKDVQIYDHRRIVTAMRARDKKALIHEVEIHFASLKQYFAINEKLYK